MLEAKLDLEREFETIIGLEVHVELKTGSKLFCGCKTSFGDPPNTNTCPVCLALPGALPVLNREAVRYAVKAALALECRVARVSKFDRKNYFYPDLPKAYQISQYDLPLGSHGQVRIRVPDGQGGVRVKSVRIRRLHLEEDAGKLNHLGGDHLADAEESLVDLNRAGIPLIEIVSEPDLASPEEARLYLQELRAILRLLDISDLRMAEGSMRVDANVSLKPRDWSGSLEDLPRTEIKNVNSLRFVQRALEYEVERQRDLLLRGERVIRETRGFDEATGTTYSQRSKEEAHDYRYFPEPDLPPLVLEESWVEGIRAEIPALPDALRAELTAAGLGPKEAEALVTDPPALAYWRSLVAAGIEARTAGNWMLADVARLLNAHGHGYDETPLTPERLVGLLRLIDQGRLSGRMAKEVLDRMYETGAEAAQVVEELGLAQISDEEALRPVVEAVLAEHAKVVADVLAGKDKALGFLVGQVMKRTRGQASPETVNRLLRAAIAARSS